MSQVASLTFDVDILINGKPIKIHSHKGKLFIEARNGSEYSFKIKNNSWSRKLAVCSVDGINVVSGEPAGKEDTGYVVAGRQSYEIKGFRTSNDAVNAFKFSTKEKSYAANSPQTDGDTTNCGVIGIRWYGEKVAPIPVIPYNPFRIVKRRLIDISDDSPWSNPIVYGDNTNVYQSLSGSVGTPDTFCSTTDWSAANERGVSCGNSMRSLNFDMGTEFSDKQISDTVSETTFERAEVEYECSIYYASREVLESWGVPLEKEIKVSFPSAFPSKFCKPPKK